MKLAISKINSGNTLYHAYVILLSAFFVSSLFIEKGVDVLWINGNHNPQLDIFFSVITNFGHGLVFLLIAVIMLFIRFEYALICVAICGVQAILISLFKKVLFADSVRPTKLLDNNLLHFVPGVEVHSFHSFPSGHTTTAFCAALLLGLISRNPIIGWVSLAIAAMVGYSRIFLLQHFLMDVAAGAVIGCFITYAVWTAFNSWEKPLWMKSKLEIKINNNRTSPREMA